MTPVVRRLLIAALVIVVLLLAADRASAYIAEREAGDRLQSSQNLASRPDVDIAGFPFLTQLAAGKFDEITVTADDVRVGEQGHRLDLSQVRVVLHALTVSRSFDRVQADRADATATAAYADLSRTLGVDVRYAGDGRIAATRRLSVAGRSITARVSARPELAGGALSFRAVRVEGVGDVPGVVTDELTRAFDLDIPLQGIPFDVRVRALRVEPAGLFVELTGRDLTYVRS